MDDELDDVPEFEGDLNIRRAVPEDATVVAEMTDAAYRVYLPALGRKPQPMTTDYREMIAHPGHTIWLLEKSGRAAGLLALIREEESLLIHSLAILPEYQGQGLGGLLLKFAEAQAERGGFQMVRLYTNALMGDNVGYYKARGYQETGREPGRTGTTVYMAKVLTDR